LDRAPLLRREGRSQRHSPCASLASTITHRWNIKVPNKLTGGKKMKKTWKVSVEWAVYAIAHVEAETLKEAIKIAEDPEFPLPTDTNYIDGTFKTDEGMSVELNKGG
jgi:hypothetical protein